AVHHVGGSQNVSPRLSLHEGLFDQRFKSEVIGNATVDQQAVMAVTGVRVERHVEHKADIETGCPDCTGGGADEIVRVERFEGIIVPQVRVGIGKQCNRR